MIPATKIDRIGLHRCQVSLISPVIGARQVHSTRTVWIIELSSDGISGFGEVTALELPNYSYEWSEGSAFLLKYLLLPSLIEKHEVSFHSFDWLVGNGASRIAIECALLDLLAKEAGIGMTEYMAGMFESDSYDRMRRLKFGVSIGTLGGWDTALSELSRASQAGARRVKFKVDRARTVEFLKGDLQFGTEEVIFDFNGSLTLDDLHLLGDLDQKRLSIIEEPIRDLGLVGYSNLSKSFDTRVFLDESGSLPAVVNDLGCFRDGLGLVVKPFRFGSIISLHGALELLADHNVPCYAGGMFESSIGRRFLMAVASHRCFSDTGDMAPSSWYYDKDLGRPVIEEDDGSFVSPNFGTGSDVFNLANHRCTEECLVLI